MADNSPAPSPPRENNPSPLPPSPLPPPDEDTYKINIADCPDEVVAEVTTALELLHQRSVILVFRGRVIPRREEAHEFFASLLPGNFKTNTFYPHGKGVWHIVFPSADDAALLLRCQGLILGRHSATLHPYVDGFSLHKLHELVGGMYPVELLMLDVPAELRGPKALELLSRPLGQLMRDQVADALHAAPGIKGPVKMRVLVPDPAKIKKKLVIDGKHTIRIIVPALDTPTCFRCKSKDHHVKDCRTRRNRA